MELRIEWRTRGECDDVIVFIDDDNNTVRRTLEADTTVLRVFLNNIVDLDVGPEDHPVDDAKRDPEAWGNLVMARANTGEVLEMDPELFWHNIAVQFRMRGTDAWVRPPITGPN